MVPVIKILSATNLIHSRCIKCVKLERKLIKVISVLSTTALCLKNSQIAYICVNIVNYSFVQYLAKKWKPFLYLPWFKKINIEKSLRKLKNLKLKYAFAICFCIQSMNSQIYFGLDVDQLGPSSLLGQLGQIGLFGQLGRLGQLGQLGHLNQLGQLGQFSQLYQLGQLGQLGQFGQLNQPGQLGQLNQPGQLGQLGQLGSFSQLDQLNQPGVPGPLNHPFDASTKYVCIKPLSCCW